MTGMLGGALPFGEGALVHVAAASAEALLAGAPATIGLFQRGELGDVWLVDDGPAGKIEVSEPGWLGAMAEWWKTQGVVLQRGTPTSAPLLVVGGAELLERPAIVTRVRDVDTNAVVAIGGLGAEAGRGQDVAAARARLVEIAANGGLLHAEPVLRFGAVGRAFVELVEEVSHRVGPDGQSLVADTIRAALFGRHGAVPVNLAAREAPPTLDLSTLFVFFVASAEL